MNDADSFSKEVSEFNLDGPIEKQDNSPECKLSHRTSQIEESYEQNADLQEIKTQLGLFLATNSKNFQQENIQLIKELDENKF